MLRLALNPVNRELIRWLVIAALATGGVLGAKPLARFELAPASSSANASVADAAASGATTSSPNAAAEVTRLRDSIPAATIAYADIPDLEITIGHIKNAPLGKILADEEWRQFLEPLRLRLSKSAFATLGIQGGGGPKGTAGDG